MSMLYDYRHLVSCIFLSSGDEKDLTFPGTNDRESGAKERQVIVIELNG